MGRGTRPWLGLLNVLGDHTRWHIYQEIRRAGQPLNRQEIAERVGIHPRLATFHLERLLEAGMLNSHYARPPGRSGPGAGRTSKYYAPADVELDLSIPQRGYELVGTMLVDALLAAVDGEPPRDAALSIASQQGQEIGDGARRGQTPRTTDHQGREALTGLLEDLGYEPYPAYQGLALRNCPFHALAQRSPDLVCAMNHAFLAGILHGLGEEDVEAVLSCYQPGDCCVIFQPQPA